MIRTCPKCGDYYADDSLAFCLTDGAPLLGVEQFSEKWREGSRVLEEKQRRLRKQQRRLKRRRVLTSMTTMLIATMVLCVVAINGLIYLKPERERALLTSPLKPPNTPDELPTLASTSSTPDETPGETRPSPSPTLSAVPTPTPKRTATGETSTPSPSPLPSPSPSVSPSPSPVLTHTPSPSPPLVTEVKHDDSPAPDGRGTPVLVITQEAPPSCSDADKAREREFILQRFGDGWRRRIEGERRQIVHQNGPRQNGQTDVETVELSLSAIEYTSTFLKGCSAATFTARYYWRVGASLTGQGATIAREKRFICARISGVWFCS